MNITTTPTTIYHITRISDSGADLYLDHYGPTLTEMEWTTNRTRAMPMRLSNAKVRLPTVRKFWPDAEVEAAPTRAQVREATES